MYRGSKMKRSCFEAAAISETFAVRYQAFWTPGRGATNMNLVRPQPSDAIVVGQRAKFGR